MKNAPTRLPHAWVLYVAALAPACAIAFAFALGPAPSKYLAPLGQATPAEARTLMGALPEAALDALAEAIRRPDAPHRALAAEILGTRGHAEAVPALVDVYRDPSAPEGLKQAALRALDQLDPAAATRARSPHAVAPHAGGAS